jgi:hypothetical protein
MLHDRILVVNTKILLTPTIGFERLSGWCSGGNQHQPTRSQDRRVSKAFGSPVPLTRKTGGIAGGKIQGRNRVDQTLCCYCADPMSHFVSGFNPFDYHSVGDRIFLFRPASWRAAKAIARDVFKNQSLWIVDVDCTDLELHDTQTPGLYWTRSPIVAHRVSIKPCLLMIV